MALKAKLLQSAYDGLPDNIKAEYKKEGEEYVLQVEGSEDTGALKRAKDHEKTARIAAEKERDELKVRNEELETELDEAVKGKETGAAAVEERWKAKEAKAKADGEAAIKKRDAQLENLLVNNVAIQLAAEIAGDNAEILLPHIAKRLKADLSGTEPATLVLNPDGTPSGMNTQDLVKEFLASPKFSSIVVGSKASGSGAKPGASGGGATTPKLADFDKMGDAERAKLHKDNPQEFERLVEESRKAKQQ